MSNSKEHIPCIIVRVAEIGNSGWFQEGTSRSAFPKQLQSAQLTFIPNTGMRRKEIELTDEKGNPILDEKGEKQYTYMDEQIRYIKNQRVISVAEQEKLGIKPSKKDTMDDKIIIKWQEMMVWKSGSTVGLYDYLLTSYYNGSNPDRPNTASVRYKIVEVDKIAEEKLDDEDDYQECRAYILKLRTKKGDKYEYNDEKIDMLAQIFTIYAPTTKDRLTQLLEKAKMNPKQVLELIRRSEQSVTIEINHALELDVIRIEGNAVIYADKKEMVKRLGSGTMTDEEKIDKLATYFRSKDGNHAYQVFSAKLEVAKNKKLQTS